MKIKEFLKLFETSGIYHNRYINQLKESDLNSTVALTNGECEDGGGYILKDDLMEGNTDDIRYFEEGDSLPEGDWIRVS